MGEGVERDLIARLRLEIDPPQRSRVLLILRLHLQDHPVLVELGEDGRDLPLAESVVERVVDGLREDPEARGAVAIDDQRLLQAGGEQVAGHVAQLWQGPQLLHHLRAHSVSSLASASSSVYWYWVRLV